jgi:F-type H+-transporting ATPase subunit a
MMAGDISPDQVVLWQWNFVKLNATILFTWLVIVLLTLVSWAVTRRLSTEPRMSRGQNLLEVLVLGIRDQIEEIVRHNPVRYMPFVGTLFIFIAVSNLLGVIPGFRAPTSSLSTTAGLAICVFVAVLGYGIGRHGLRGYLSQYMRPTPLMLPFHVIGELSRTLALAVRLFGNVMSAGKIGIILLAVTPLFFPVLMDVLGLLTGLIHAYIFAILTMVYIASAMRAHQQDEEQLHEQTPDSSKGEH